MSINEFLRDRRAAIISAVRDDDWLPMTLFCHKYEMTVPSNARVFHAGVYKMAHECADIPEEIKELAAMKCMDLGFRPWVG